VPVTAYPSLFSPERNALLDVVEGVEAAFFEYGLAPDTDGVRALTDAESASTEDGHAVAGDALPDHFSSESAAETSRFDASRRHYVAMRRLPLIGRMVREQTPGRPSAVVQSNVETESRRGSKVHRRNGLTGGDETVSNGDGRRPDR
jgi:hypothetical protein